ncbi:uncharacterized protein LOC129592054 [Paramacrobiotus metropolitanus]|uniref:uncharacterized protein LOC129592054 n=1 Tax=Paramacrobiotus metropolitanus TaxID=2943436 RepID=UPI0024456107|nr:uncharacterized protein LOC129592054 [Paramacrobiotus metropolitanus]
MAPEKKDCEKCTLLPNSPSLHVIPKAGLAELRSVAYVCLALGSLTLALVIPSMRRSCCLTGNTPPSIWPPTAQPSCKKTASRAQKESPSTILSDLQFFVLQWKLFAFLWNVETTGFGTVPYIFNPAEVPFTEVLHHIHSKAFGDLNPTQSEMDALELLYLLISTCYTFVHFALVVGFVISTTILTCLSCRLPQSNLQLEDAVLAGEGSEKDNNIVVVEEAEKYDDLEGGNHERAGVFMESPVYSVPKVSHVHRNFLLALTALLGSFVPREGVSS